MTTRSWCKAGSSLHSAPAQSHLANVASRPFIVTAHQYSNISNKPCMPHLRLCDDDKVPPSSVPLCCFALIVPLHPAPQGPRCWTLAVCPEPGCRLPASSWGRMTEEDSCWALTYKRCAGVPCAALFAFGVCWQAAARPGDGLDVRACQIQACRATLAARPITKHIYRVCAQGALLPPAWMQTYGTKTADCLKWCCGCHPSCAILHVGLQVTVPPRFCDDRVKVLQADARLLTPAILQQYTSDVSEHSLPGTVCCNAYL